MSVCFDTNGITFVFDKFPLCFKSSTRFTACSFIIIINRFKILKWKAGVKILRLCCHFIPVKTFFNSNKRAFMSFCLIFIHLYLLIVQFAARDVADCIWNLSRYVLRSIKLSEINISLERFRIRTVLHRWC